MPANPSRIERPATGLDQSEPRFVATPEGRIAWHECGDEASASLPLVLLHGFTGHRDDFLGIMTELGEQRRVLAPDLRGHGDTDSTEGRLGWCFEQLVADLVSYLDALEIDRIDLLGHSVGGFVALRFALAHPERVRSLVFLCTAPETPSEMDPKGWRAASGLAEARGMEGLQPPAEKVIRADPFPGLPAWGDVERYYAHHARRHLSMTPESYREVGQMFFESTSLVSRLPEVAVPTLVLVGEQDVDWLPGAALFEENLPNVRRVTIRDAEHHPHQENRAAFMRELKAHLASVEIDAAQS